MKRCVTMLVLLGAVSFLLFQLGVVSLNSPRSKVGQPSATSPVEPPVDMRVRRVASDLDSATYFGLSGASFNIPMPPRGKLTAYLQVHENGKFNPELSGCAVYHAGKGSKMRSFKVGLHLFDPARILPPDCPLNKRRLSLDFGGTATAHWIPQKQYTMATEVASDGFCPSDGVIVQLVKWEYYDSLPGSTRLATDERIPALSIELLVKIEDTSAGGRMQTPDTAPAWDRTVFLSLEQAVRP